MKKKLIDYVLFMTNIRLLIWIVITIINLINLIFFNNDYILIIVLTVYIFITLESLIIILLIRHNNKIINGLYGLYKKNLINIDK